jgi:hypothetical protein
MDQVLYITYVLCGIVTISVAVWIRVADDPETYFWGFLLWPFLLVAMICSIIRSIWTGQDLFHEEERKRVRVIATPSGVARLFRFRLKRRARKHTRR